MSDPSSDKRLSTSTDDANAPMSAPMKANKQGVKKTQADLLQRLNRPSGITSKWTTAVDPLKPQPIRSNLPKRLDPMPHTPHSIYSHTKVHTDITSTLLARLSNVESLNRQLQSTINEKNSEITRLKGLIDSQSNHEKIKVLENKNSNMEKKVADMESWFLRHGMIWDQTQVIFNVKELMDAVDSLNQNYQSEPRVFLAIYRNGYILDEYEFQSWNEPTGIQFIRDIFQGKPPGDALQNYPQGVQFEVFDRHDQDFVDLEQDKSNSDELENRTEWKYDSKPLSKIGTLTHKPRESLETFMTRHISRFAIRAGNVIEIRQGLTDLINVSLISNDKGTEGKIQVSVIKDENQGKGFSQKVKLRVRVSNTLEYVVHVDSLCKIIDLKKLLAKNSSVLRDFSDWDFKMPLGLGSKLLLSDNKTLQECQLIPSARLFIAFKSK